MLERMTKMHWFQIGWTLLVIAWMIKFDYWERIVDGGWVDALIGLGVYLAVTALAHLGQRLEKTFNIGEARFNSRTGKVLKPGEPNR
ncbi:hypothetical protein [Erythrobacter sp. Alg231-14]|uniref:hypothetical protein n=1 Tax=Erythrobacter sp. Alg231-14 TaxID=1922225 RepID=UPI000D54D78F